MKVSYCFFPVLFILSSTFSLFSQNFNCGENLIDARDGQSYPTILIGSQCWMAKNLNYGTYTESINAGVPHSNVSNDGIVQKYCYNNTEANCATNGGLYEWDELMNYTETEKTQGICPDGWHVPSDQEVKEMEMAIGMSQAEADNIGQRGTDEGAKLQSGGTSGFEALLLGYRFAYGSFAGDGTEAYFWTSTIDEADNTKAYYRCLRNTHTKVERGKDMQIHGFSLRCVLGAGMSIGKINNNKFYLSPPIPNPAKSTTIINYKLPPNIFEGNIIIYDITGKEVKTIKIDNLKETVEINTSQLTQGTYFYLLKFSNGQTGDTKTLIIQ